ncbi:hypothetical protein TRFO_33234 [Tritrichomonas foetus]|uniref:Protein kinase domain-containing protein n=1 Tax=Tritrichomonas foetus TaxID=1144522 RepID=A0A1J4JM36_9EUKA|nr:hypothetical protein TRFO_33234 [Tritrichomonas foetus]|eukprot:OHT00159.1 hypothetical protein TRFO_33234 [Tritrichomonas foetus]
MKFSMKFLIDILIKFNKKKISSNYMAPEIKNGQPYDEKADIYSYGLLIYYIYSGIHPYHEILGQSVDIVRQNLLNTQKDLNLKIDNFHELPDDILKILKRCLNPIPSERPTFKKICSKLMKIVLMKPSSMLNNCNMKINSHYSNLETFFNQLKVIIDLPDSYEQSMNFDFSLDSLIQIIQPYQHHYIGLIFLCGAHQQGSHQ